ncbi:hypothetical protein FHL15_002026 [Xylaria flabelliformis]|uniref:Uncharacterized protein n=1 Tax=Xylaria flabelliformis TaxID=2512241 RepID=A0A553IAK9_9PEZI|nr:hypothetical protein FHL15_002026 [Xylaria flabelliformis]
MSIRLPYFQGEMMLWQHIGGPRIHVLRPAPDDVFHWLQDFACPIYQTLYAKTNECISPNSPPPVTSSEIIIDGLHRKLVKADLSLLNPDVHMGRRISSHADEQDIRFIAQRIGRIVKSLRHAYPRYVHDINAYMASEEEFSSNFDLVQSCTNSFLLFHVGTENLVLPQMPRTVRDRLQRQFANVRFVLRNLKACLDIWQKRENDRLKYYHGARKGVSFLGWVVEMANRGLADYVPGPIHQCLPRANIFKQAEIRRAGQRFAFDPTQDLVYLTDPRHPDLFVQLHPRTLPIVTVEQRIRRHYYLGLRRDAYGFVDFSTILEDREMFSREDLWVVKHSYRIYRFALEEMSKGRPEQRINIHQVVDIDYVSIGQTSSLEETSSEGDIYRRTKRERV